MTDDSELLLMPRIVRDKLDRVGIKLHLKDWQRLGLEERRRLCDQPCEAPVELERYRRELETLIRQRIGGTPEYLQSVEKQVLKRKREISGQIKALNRRQIS